MNNTDLINYINMLQHTNTFHAVSYIKDETIVRTVDFDTLIVSEFKFETITGKIISNKLYKLISGAELLGSSQFSTQKCCNKIYRNYGGKQKV